MAGFLDVLDPSFNAQQQNITQQQALAQMLLQQGMTPEQGQMVSGHYIAPAFGGLGRLANIWAANEMQKKNMGDQTELDTRHGKIMGDALSNLFGDGQPQQAQQQPQAAPQSLTDSAISQATGSPSQAQPMPQQTQRQPMHGGMVGDPRSMAEIASLFPGAMDSIIANRFTTPDAVKTMDLTGQNRQLMGALAEAEARKKGIIEYNPGTTSQDLLTGQTRFQPKVGEGIGLNGNGSTYALPGYSGANASIKGSEAGAMADAQEAAKDLYAKPDSINTEDGNILMTPNQQRDYAKRGARLQTPEQAAWKKAKTDAKIAGNTSGAQIQPLRSLISQAYALVKTMPEGLAGKVGVDIQNAVAGSPLERVAGNEASVKVAQWKAITAQLKLNVIQQLAASGITRMDIPIVKMVNEAGEIDPFAPNSAKTAKISQIQSELENMNLSAQNRVGGFDNMAGNPPANAPMTTAVQFTSPNGQHDVPVSGGMPSMDAIQAEIARRRRGK